MRDLLGEKPKKAKPPDSRVVVLEKAYIERHERRWGVTPIRVYGRDRKLLGTLADQLADEELVGLMDLYFDKGVYAVDREVERSNFTVPDFYRLVPHLRLLRAKQAERRTSGNGTRTAANLDAAARAIERK